MTGHAHGLAPQRPFVQIDPITGWVLLVASATGLASSWLLSVDRLHVLADYLFVPPCFGTQLINCRTVLQDAHATLFGLPLPLLGIAAFAFLTSSSLAMLAQAHIRSWYLWILLAGTVTGVVLVHWLVYQSAFVLGALCGYCVAVWIATLVALGAIASAYCAHMARSRSGYSDSALWRILYDWMPAAIMIWLAALALFVTLGLVL